MPIQLENALKRGCATTIVVLSLLLAEVSPVEAGENLGLCESDRNGEVAADFGSGVQWCFDGARIVLRNDSAVVLEFVGGSNASRSVGTFTFGGDQVEVNYPDERIVPPGYSLNLGIDSSGEVIEVFANGEASLLYHSSEVEAEAIGLIPGAGDIPQLFFAAAELLGELNHASTLFDDCVQKAASFLHEGGCFAENFVRVSSIVGGAVINGVPIVNDVPKVVRWVTGGTGVALSYDALVPRFEADLDRFAEGRAITVASGSLGNSSGTRTDIAKALDSEGRYSELGPVSDDLRIAADLANSKGIAFAWISSDANAEDFARSLASEISGYPTVFRVVESEHRGFLA